MRVLISSLCGLFLTIYFYKINYNTTVNTVSHKELKAHNDKIRRAIKNKIELEKAIARRKRLALKLKLQKIAHRKYIKEQENCLSMQIYAEAGNDNYKGMRAVGMFTYNEAKKGKRTICQEMKYKMSGGAFKYSWQDNEKYFYNRRYKNNAECYKYNLAVAIAKNILNEPAGLKKRYNHYITVELAKSKNVPRWFRNYIVNYKIIGKHVFAELDFKNRNADGYKKFLKDV